MVAKTRRTPKMPLEGARTVASGRPAHCLNAIGPSGSSHIDPRACHGQNSEGSSQALQAVILCARLANDPTPRWTFGRACNFGRRWIQTIASSQTAVTSGLSGTGLTRWGYAPQQAPPTFEGRALAGLVFAAEGHLALGRWVVCLRALHADGTSCGGRRRMVFGSAGSQDREARATGDADSMLFRLPLDTSASFNIQGRRDPVPWPDFGGGAQTLDSRGPKPKPLAVTFRWRAGGQGRGGDVSKALDLGRGDDPDAPPAWEAGTWGAISTADELRPRTPLTKRACGEYELAFDARYNAGPRQTTVRGPDTCALWRASVEGGASGERAGKDCTRIPSDSGCASGRPPAGTGLGKKETAGARPNERAPPRLVNRLRHLHREAIEGLGNFLGWEPHSARALAQLWTVARREKPASRRPRASSARRFFSMGTSSHDGEGGLDGVADSRADGEAAGLLAAEGWRRPARRHPLMSSRPREKKN